MTSLAEIKAAAEAAQHPELDAMAIAIKDVFWLVERCEELHKVATALLGAYGRCAAYTLDDLHLSREERAWVDRVLAETREP